MFFDLNPPKAILGDLNPDLIKMYREIKYRLTDVMDELATLPPADRKEYLRLRGLDTTSLTGSESAARFIYLNRFCFNGIYRTNLKGKFNVPYGGARSGCIPSIDVFRTCSRRLKKARLVPGDFEKVLDHAKQGDFIYMDPPFAITERRMFREYDPAAFAPKDIERLRKRMKLLDASGIDFVVSYAESKEADLLAKGFQAEVVPVRRNIAGFAANRIISNEIMITNMKQVRAPNK